MRSSAAQPEAVIFRSGARRKTAAYFPGETLLDSARRAGVLIPTSCEQGDCGTCMVELLRGEVVMANNNALSPEELSAGQVLACQAVPTSEHCEVLIS